MFCKILFQSIGYIHVACDVYTQLQICVQRSLVSHEEDSLIGKPCKVLVDLTGVHFSHTRRTKARVLRGQPTQVLTIDTVWVKAKENSAEVERPCCISGDTSPPFFA